ncbi:SpoIVB peptidase [Alicyclobacillus sp. ALC3]|uniref:SpoIVB peptidase n=1 Tax=Alicyclobacillus sp. ALC3 TaxID=2796143 RepID=UPI002379517E|nr:SpoIVB peptidase [Alicyclobacillus sp. ALC3]WDL97040.1 SpoIVB peptidase [Alicyclobacillus sp. ALC3]
MQKHGFSKHLRVAFAVLCSCLVLCPPVRHLAEMPADVDLPLGQSTQIPVGVPLQVRTDSSLHHVIRVKPMNDTEHDGTAITVLSTDLGDADVKTRLFGVIPWKTVRVHVVPEDHVFVGGQSIGVNLHSNGVMVVGFQPIAGKRSPSAAAHLQLGDVIVRVSGHAVHSSEDLVRLVQASTGVLHMEVLRHSASLKLSVLPERDELGSLHLGLYVRDKAAGVGTLTFYEPQHHRFGALGHVIADADTGQPIVGTGNIYEADVTGMVKGRAGQPGEKRGRFRPSDTSLGRIEENTDFGVFGSMDNMPPDSLLSRELPVALPSQVQDGPAELWTVLHGRRVQAFSVEIETRQQQDKPTTKSMVVHVTDPRLLKESGGIVQGMSGSPLVQNGRLIGAVTHVFVSDPTRGYGVYAEWMLREAESPEEQAGESRGHLSKTVGLHELNAKTIQSFLAGHTHGSSN